MANSSRLIIDQEDKMMIPMNVEGTLGEENLITFPKLITLMITLAICSIELAWLINSHVSLVEYIIIFIPTLIIASFVIRFYIFDEKKYYRIYKETDGRDSISPYEFWNIASIHRNGNCVTLMYNDAKVGILVKLKRDVLTGKEDGYEEIHYDAVSDFLKALNKARISYVHMDLMENADNDARLNSLDELVNGTDNQNINKIVEMNVTYIRNISKHTLCEAEYYLLYSENIVREEDFIDEVERDLDILIRGAYKGYKIIGAKGIAEVNEMAKEQHGVSFFNANEAAIRAYKSSNSGILNSIKIESIRVEGKDLEINKVTADRLIMAVHKKKNDAIAEIDNIIMDINNDRLELDVEIEKGNDNNDIIDF